MTGPERRRDAVARLVRTRRIGTQDALLAALAREGFKATQATLSRDLTRLGARRVSRPEGAFYEVDGPASEDGLAALRGLVVAVAANDSMVVVRTAAGAASAVARAVDEARRPEIMGTIAGDDTIFVAPARTLRPRRLAGLLATLLGVAERAGPSAGTH
jgi:transcriptional regulator of arginine metabolism